MSSEFNIFGLSSPLEKSDLILYPVAWELTTSYGRGTFNGPTAIEKASGQIDLYDIEFGEFYKRGIHMMDRDPNLYEIHRLAQPASIEAFDASDDFGTIPESQNENIEAVNSASEEMVSTVYKYSKEILQEKGFMGLIGGDHSAPLGLIKAISEKHGSDFGILHIDAHADLRESYQGFKHSHASIMDNVMSLENAPSHLIQVGIRDFCKEEYEKIQSDSRIRTYFDQHLQESLLSGTPWMDLTKKIVCELPDKVYISFDIDGLSPEYCPNTGTPVPGGLSFSQAIALMSELKKQNKKVIGFDLCEVAPGFEKDGEWDGNVGSRILFKLCGHILNSNG